jgi:microcompartment protein CcmK/EutM
MKKLLFALTAVFGFSALSAQTTFDMELGLVSPTTTVTGGVPFTFEVSITNNGPGTIPAGDTIFFAPLFGGSALQDANGNPVVYGNILQSALGANQSVNFTRPLNVNGGQSGTLNVCGIIVAHYGAAAGGELDSTNWEDCSQITYTSTVSVADYVFQNTEDKSYFSNGILFINVENLLESDRINYDIINLAGQVVQNGVVVANGSNAREEVALRNVPAGVYIVRINDGANFNSTRKIMVH